VAIFQKSTDRSTAVLITRLSRARKNVEYAFGMLYSKFEVLGTAVKCRLKSVHKIVKCICTFHSFVRIKEEKMSQTSTLENNSVLMSSQFQTLLLVTF
jgi:hypothetical protein